MSDTTQAFPTNWKIGQDFDPNEHLMQLKGRDYLNVQNRLLWFIRDQRALIVAGLAKVPYIVQTDLVEMDRQTSWAHFRTYVRDVLGNEATMYGSESAKDFADYAEKASTKSLGRALLALGYGTAFAPEMDEGERVVDTPVERRTTTTDKQPQPPQMNGNGNGNGNATKRQPARSQVKQEPVVDPALDPRLDAILRRTPDLRKTYMEAKKYGLQGNEFFRVFLNVTGWSKKELVTLAPSAAHKEAMAKYVAGLAQQAQAAQARTPDLATVATPAVRA